MEFIEIGSSPIEEECAQVGKDDYYEKCMAELNQLKRMMIALHPPVEGTYYKIKAFPHDFGTYHELVAMYWDMSPEAVEWAYGAEAKCPSTWDQEALKALVKFYPEYEERIENGS